MNNKIFYQFIYSALEVVAVIADIKCINNINYSVIKGAYRRCFHVSCIRE